MSHFLHLYMTSLRFCSTVLLISRRSL